MDLNHRFYQVLRDWSEVFTHYSVDEFQRFMDRSGLSPSQIHTLMLLHHEGVCGVSHISDHIGITSAASSQMVDRLVQQGLLERSEDPDDRRSKKIRLTPQGLALVEEGFKARLNWMLELTHTLSPDQLESTINALLLLTQAARKLQHTAPEADSKAAIPKS